MKKHGKSGSKRRGVLFLVITLVLLIAFVGAAVMFENRVYTPVTTDPAVTASGKPEATEEATAPETQPTEATMPTVSADVMKGKQVLNILITGQDRRDPEGWGRSDTMILCSINAQTDTVTMVSFLRDLYVPIPGHGSSRLNAAYSWGGAELLNDTLAQNFGAPIDGNIEIDFYDFIALIDYLGGVTVDLTAAETKYLNKNNNWDLTEGENLLTGPQALSYSRIRYLDSDFVRTERQRNVLSQVLKKLQGLSWNELQDAMDMLLENSTMSFSSDELFLYTLGFYPVLSNGEIVTAQIPADGTWSYGTVSGMSIIKADLEKNKAILNELLKNADAE